MPLIYRKIIGPAVKLSADEKIRREGVQGLVPILLVSTPYEGNIRLHRPGSIRSVQDGIMVFHLRHLGRQIKRAGFLPGVVHHMHPHRRVYRFDHVPLNHRTLRFAFLNPIARRLGDAVGQTVGEIIRYVGPVFGQHRRYN